MLECVPLSLNISLLLFWNFLKESNCAGDYKTINGLNSSSAEVQKVDILLPSKTPQYPTFYAIKLYPPTLILLTVSKSDDWLTFDQIRDLNMHF